MCVETYQDKAKWQERESQLLLCRHGALQHYCWWNRYVANPIKKWGYVGQGRGAMRLLKNEILDKVLLRRTKVQCADVLALPPRYMMFRRAMFWSHALHRAMLQGPSCFASSHS